MPIYEYECRKCGEMSEVWQRFSDKPITQCPKCKGKLRKMISQSSFHLKGTGWYATDYASKTGTLKEKTKPADKNKTKPAETKSSGDVKKE